MKEYEAEEESRLGFSFIFSCEHDVFPGRFCEGFFRRVALQLLSARAVWCQVQAVLQLCHTRFGSSRHISALLAQRCCLLGMMKMLARSPAVLRQFCVFWPAICHVSMFYIFLQKPCCSYSGSLGCMLISTLNNLLKMSSEAVQEIIKSSGEFSRGTLNSCLICLVSNTFHTSFSKPSKQHFAVSLRVLQSQGVESSRVRTAETQLCFPLSDGAVISCRSRF